ncbi:unnamed protein product [Sphenostylis stenocarpa]|uniref:Uncharacterized protein n=1 Tax=Sphenostylis stenocarpa TaxID=92480 RepID=A0AA86VL78_9FABA|nr:unnamed protein product [Sphenostylis stenocarpa]
MQRFQQKPKQKNEAYAVSGVFPAPNSYSPTKFFGSNVEVNMDINIKNSLHA